MVIQGRRKHLDTSRGKSEVEWPRAGCHIVKAQGSRGDNLIEASPAFS